MGNMTPQQFTSVHASECCHSVSYVTYKPFEYVAFITVWNSSQVIPCIGASFTDTCMQIVMSMWLFVVFVRDSEIVQGKNVSSSEFYISFIFVTPEVIAVNGNILASWNVMPRSLVGRTVLVYVIASVFKGKVSPMPSVEVVDSSQTLVCHYLTVWRHIPNKS